MNDKSLFLGMSLLLLLLAVLLFLNEEQERNNKLELAKMDLEKGKQNNFNAQQAEKNEKIQRERKLIRF